MDEARLERERRKALGYRPKEKVMTRKDYEQYIINDEQLLVELRKKLEETERELEYFPDDQEVLENNKYFTEAIKTTEDGIKSWKEAIEEIKKNPQAGEAPGESASPPEEVPTPPTEQPPPEPERIFKIHEKVMARGDDRKLHPAQVVGVTGVNHQQRKYIVKFLDDKFGRRAELTGKDVKVNFLEERKKAEKKKAQEEAEAVKRARAAGIFAGAAAIKPEFQQREPSKVSDGPPKSETMKPRKLENSRTYNSHANNWKEFQKKGKVAKRTKKESMFRTVEGNVSARVGVIGSGRGMTQDQVRVKHKFATEDPEDFEP